MEATMENSHKALRVPSLARRSDDTNRRTDYPFRPIGNARLFAHDTHLTFYPEPQMIDTYRSEWPLTANGALLLNYHR